MLQNIVEDYSTPDKALNKCWEASDRLLNIMLDMGMDDVWIIACSGWEGNIGDMHKWYSSYIETRESIHHYMVRVGESYIDFTSKQFFRDAPYPTVYTSDDMDAMWTEWGEE